MRTDCGTGACVVITVLCEILPCFFGQFWRAAHFSLHACHCISSLHQCAGYRKVYPQTWNLLRMDGQYHHEGGEEYSLTCSQCKSYCTYKNSMKGRVRLDRANYSRFIYLYIYIVAVQFGPYSDR